jgi:DNA-binding beta-propeller fold protein YncE
VVDPDTARVARIDASGRLSLSPSGLFRQPADVASCSAGILVTDAAAGRIAVLETDLSFRTWLAEDLVRPTGITCDGERVFVVETGSHRILQFVEGRPGPALGSRGTESGQFNFPTSVTVHDGKLLVGDALNFRLQQLDPDTGRATTIFGRLGNSPGDMARLKGIAVDRRGHIWVADAHLDRVSLYRRDGEFLLSLGGTGSRLDQFSFPAGIAASPDGRVAVIDSLNLRVKIFRVLDRAQGEDA